MKAVIIAILAFVVCFVLGCCKSAKGADEAIEQEGQIREEMRDHAD